LLAVLGFMSVGDLEILIALFGSTL
jgi:hypothetical protein